MKDDDEIHEFGSCPLRSQRDYGERTAGRSEIGTVQRVLDRLAGFRYGCVYTDDTCETDMATMDERDGRSIYIQSPMEFWRRGIGMCHDASVLVDAMLRHEGIPHVCIYLSSEQPPHYPTHSFILMRQSDGSIAIVDVFATKECVYPERFESYSDALRWRVMKWIDEDNDGNPDIHVFAGRCMPCPRCDFMEFSTEIVDSFTEVDF